MYVLVGHLGAICVPRNSAFAKKRQIAAIFAAPGRTAALKKIDTSKLPCLVVHGAQDRFVRTDNGKLIHEALEGSSFLEV